MLCLALNYGGRQEIVDAARRLARETAEGKRAWEAVEPRWRALEERLRQGQAQAA